MVEQRWGIVAAIPSNTLAFRSFQINQVTRITPASNVLRSTLATDFWAVSHQSAKSADGEEHERSRHQAANLQEMGCFNSKPNDTGAIRRRPGSIGEVAVFVPGLRVPESSDELPLQPLGDGLPRRLTERLAALRNRIIVMAAHEALYMTKPTWRITITQHGGSKSADLLQALEDYLPTLLGLVKDGSELEDKVQFAWMNQEDDAEDTSMPSAWYEVLSVLHLMALLRLSQANSLLVPKTSIEGYHAKVSEENKRASVEIFLKAAGYLECAIQHVLPKISPEKRWKGLPVDLAEGILKAICMQALGQAIDVQLGLAIDSPKATLAVKRRLACEMVKCWQQAHESISDLPLLDGWAEKHRLFVTWKHIEAKAAAYYYHGLILDEGNSEKSHRTAVAALQSAEELLKESKAACEAFHAASPKPAAVGIDEEKIHKESSCKVRINKDLYNKDNIIIHDHADSAPPLPDFAVALKPDEYRLPPPLTDTN
uniref:BRO1 domain-containing protein n=1 Tax=Oryza barthii TaxID=65489 RepID=A0A0D3FCC9_9ORYZ